MTTIESKGYIATANDIEALVRGRCEAANAIGDSRTTYLRALIATTQDKLGISPKAVRTASKGEADNDTIKAQALALEEVHTLFYEAVQRAAKAIAVHSEEPRPKADVIASRIIFARSAYSVIRNWLLRGKHTMSNVIASKATKALLVSQTPKRATVSNMARVRALQTEPLLKQASTLLDRIVVYGKQDRDKAIAILHDMVIMLSRGFNTLGLKAQPILDAVDHTATSVIPEAMAKKFRKAA